MKIGIMQPYFFPYLGYFQLLNYVDKYVVYDDVNYIKRGWVNRNQILLNNQKYLITLPLDGASPFKPINETRISPNISTKEKLIKTIERAYKKAPYFSHIFPIIQTVIMDKSLLLSNALYKQLELIKDYLEINTELIMSSNLKKNSDLKGQEKIIQICNILNGTEYINAIGGQDLYSKKFFQEKGIKLSFLYKKAISYRQFNNDCFVDNLSMIDVLMFNNKNEIKKLLEDYELK